jgi:hypothetical protein
MQPHRWGSRFGTLEMTNENLCYTEMMQSNRSKWPEWARTLQRWGLGDVVAYTLEAAGPLTVFGAQLLYVGQPFLRSALPDGHFSALAGLLEDSSESKIFAAYLREEVSS